jgi:hypothetical protein
VTQAEMEAEITNLRAQLSRIEQEQKTRTDHWLRLEKVSRGIAVAFGLAAIVLIIGGAIFIARSNPIFPFALSLILSSITLGLLAQTLRSPS